MLKGGIKVLEIKNLTKSFDRCLFDDLSFKFQDQGMYVIVGESGCGKSTLLNMIGGLDKKYEGSIEIDGKEIRSISNYIRKYIGFIFQQFYLIEEMNVKENMHLIACFKRVYYERMEKYLNQLKLKDLTQYNACILSGGQKQRVAIFRSFIAKHPIILCDEPTGALDQKNSEEVFKILKNLSKEKLVIVITHDKYLAKKYHDYLYEIKDCKLRCIHQNNSIKKQSLPEKTRKKSFFNFLIKDFKLSWKSSFIVIQVLFLAILSIMLTLSLTRSTRQQIHEQLEQIIPSTTLILKKKNNQMIHQEELEKIKHVDINYHFLQNDDIEFLGISSLKKYQAKNTLYISDYIQKPRGKIQGKKIMSDQEIILSKSTYDQLLYVTQQKNLINQSVYLYFNYQNKIQAYKVKIVGVEKRNTLMETLYFKEYAFNHIIQNIYGINEGQTAFLQVKNKKIIKELENLYPYYQFKLANSSLSSSIDDKFQQIEFILLCFSSLAVVTACFLLGVVLYLMVIKKKKYFAIIQTLGASMKQMMFIVLFRGLCMSFVAFIEAFLVLNQLFIFINHLIKENISDLINQFLVVDKKLIFLILIVIICLTCICSIIPLRKVKQIDIVDALKS